MNLGLVLVQVSRLLKYRDLKVLKVKRGQRTSILVWFRERARKRLHGGEISVVNVVNGSQVPERHQVMSISGVEAIKRSFKADQSIGFLTFKVFEA